MNIIITSHVIGWSLFSISSVKKPRTGPIQEGGEMPTQPNLILNQGIFRSLLVCGDLKTFCPMIWTSTDLCRWVRVIKEARSRGRGRGPIFKNPASTDTPSESQPPPEPSKHESPPTALYLWVATQLTETPQPSRRRADRYTDKCAILWAAVSCAVAVGTKGSSCHQ